MKKGQLHLVESTVVIFVFFIMIMVAMSIYSNYQKDKLERMKIDLNEQKATQIARKILFTPELECSNNNARTLDCVEIQKLQPFVDRVRQNPAYYREEFQNSRVMIKWVYAPSFFGTFSAPEFFTQNPGDLLPTTTQKTIFDFKTGGESYRTFTFPVSLWDKRVVPEWSYFGWLIVEVNI